MLRSALVAVLVSLGLAGPAGAHGPCGCLQPRSGPPGTQVRVAYPIYKVVFDPDRSDLAIGPPSLWRAHRGGPRVLISARVEL